MWEYAERWGCLENGLSTVYCLLIMSKKFAMMLLYNKI